MSVRLVEPDRRKGMPSCGTRTRQDSSPKRCRLHQQRQSTPAKWLLSMVFRLGSLQHTHRLSTDWADRPTRGTAICEVPMSLALARLRSFPPKGCSEAIRHSPKAFHHAAHLLGLKRSDALPLYDKPYLQAHAQHRDNERKPCALPSCPQVHA